MHPDCLPDDPSIKSSDNLLRRIPPQSIIPESGKILPDAFNYFKCSVELSSKSSPEKCLAHFFPEGFKDNYVNRKANKLKKEGWVVVAFSPVLPRNYDQTIFPDHEVEIFGKVINNDAHCIICGEKDDELLYELTKGAQIVLSK